MFKLSERPKIHILHIGEFSFFMPWEQWYSKVEEVCRCKIQYAVKEQIENKSADIPASKVKENLLQNKNLIKIFEGYDLVRFDRNWSQEVFNLVIVAPPLITVLQSIDLIYKKKGSFWPQLNFKDGVHSAILQNKPYLNTNGAGLIVGSSTDAIQVAYVLAELGIKQITFVVESDNIRSPLLELMKNSLFQINFEVITKEKIILLPGIYSVMICCEDLKHNSDLLTALLYFNYLERGGLILNPVYTLDKVPLMEEALAIGATCVDLPQIQLHEEVVALQKLGLLAIDRLFQIKP